eukprot:GHVQ01000239.1.p1 GENE.GHVQ01000239.1~~GHVQ01000239.1.p1  ORF type:complete len:201 (+),score=13.95 GHVQ01000239.1:386-988(+)
MGAKSILPNEMANVVNFCDIVPSQENQPWPAYPWECSIYIAVQIYRAVGPTVNKKSPVRGNELSQPLSPFQMYTVPQFEDEDIDPPKTKLIDLFANQADDVWVPSFCKTLNLHLSKAATDLQEFVNQIEHKVRGVETELTGLAAPGDITVPVCIDYSGWKKLVWDMLVPKCCAQAARDTIPFIYDFYQSQLRKPGLKRDS